MPFSLSGALWGEKRPEGRYIDTYYTAAICDGVRSLERFEVVGQARVTAILKKKGYEEYKTREEALQFDAVEPDQEDLFKKGLPPEVARAVARMLDAERVLLGTIGIQAGPGQKPKQVVAMQLFSVKTGRLIWKDARTEPLRAFQPIKLQLRDMAARLFNAAPR
jgi:hypothetical protein